MTCPALLRGYGFASTDAWSRVFVLPSEIYLWRAKFTGLPLVRPDQALDLVRAVGTGQNLKLDVRGIALQPLADDQQTWSADLVLTASWAGPVPGVLGFRDDASDIAQHVREDPSLRSIYPGFNVGDASLLQLTGPAEAVDLWRSQPVLWDHGLGGQGHGGPTDSYAMPADYSIVLGNAEQGKQAKPWRVKQPGLEPPPGTTLGPPPGAAPQADNTVLWLLGAGVVGTLVWLGWDKKRRRKG